MFHFVNKIFGLVHKDDKFYQLYQQSTEVVCATVKKLENIMQLSSVSV